MIIDIRPKSGLLKKHIASFNMFEKSNDFQLNFFAFPQFGSTIELFKNAKISRSGTTLKIAPVKKSDSDKNKYSVEVLGKYTEPVFINYKGYVDGFTINFNPLGINYFFEQSYKKIAPENFQSFAGTKWNKFAEELFAIPDFKGRMEFAENFLENTFNDIDITGIEKAVTAIIKDPTISIQELTQVCGMSYRSLHRKFNEYVGCSPVSYKRIARFRKSIDFNGWKEQNPNCTEISYSNSFFDTSHFRKEFLKLTHQNPSTFFKTISRIGNHKFPYKLM